jgi:hypothetical protein
MQINALQPQVINPASFQSSQEVAGEREHDGDADDMNVRSARIQQAAPRVMPQGVGTKVDLFA